jgi:hypothetical protein
MQLTPSDWLAVILSLVGTGCAIFAAWYFFRAQQQTDFKRIEVILTQMGVQVTELKNIDKVVDHSTVVERLRSVQASVEGLSVNVQDLRERILSEVKNEQQVLLKTVQDEFFHHLESSRAVLQTALARELGSMIPNHRDQDRVVDKLADLIRHALNSMGEFQRASIERQSAVAIHNVEQSVGGAVEQVADHVTEVKSQISSLASGGPRPDPPPMRLPAPST